MVARRVEAHHVACPGREHPGPLRRRAWALVVAGLGQHERCAAVPAARVDEEQAGEQREDDVPRRGVPQRVEIEVRLVARDGPAVVF